MFIKYKMFALMNMQCLQLGEVRSVHDVNSVYLYNNISMYGYKIYVWIYRYTRPVFL